MPDEKRCPRCRHVMPAGAASCSQCGYAPGQPVQLPAAPAGRELLHPTERPEHHIEGAQRVTVVDIDMPFGSMVFFMVKWAIAAIPALIFLAVVFFVFALVLGGVGALAR